jgi:acyl carrier protein
MEQPIFDVVASIVRDVLRRPALQLNGQSWFTNTPAWDSFAMITMIIRIQDEFAIEFETEELDEIQNLDDLVRCISGKDAFKNPDASRQTVPPSARQT